MEKRLFTSESVTEGHPDKLCDQIADAILDALLAQDPASRVACEVTAQPGAVRIMGEVTTRARVDYPALARQVIRDAGYTRAAYGFSDSCAVACCLHRQSPDIAQGVDRGAPLEAGAGDQGTVFGYACRETRELMPLPIVLAHRLARQTAAARREGLVEGLRPDGKTQVTVAYEDGQPVRVQTVVLSAQHDPRADTGRLRRALREQVVDQAVPEAFITADTQILINPTGRFVLGGPAADTGLTGRKLMVDTYGGYARHGGGAFSGKDPTKVDRSGAYMARYIAKTIVAAGAAQRCEVQLSYAIGVAQPVSVAVDTQGTSRAGDAPITRWVESYFDLRPGAIIARFGLKRPIYRATACYGHFGRSGAAFPWEQVRQDDCEALRKALQGL